MRQGGENIEGCPVVQPYSRIFFAIISFFKIYFISVNIWLFLNCGNPYQKDTSSICGKASFVGGVIE